MQSDSRTFLPHLGKVAFVTTNDVKTVKIHIPVYEYETTWGTFILTEEYAPSSPKHLHTLSSYAAVNRQRSKELLHKAQEIDSKGYTEAVIDWVKKL